MHTTLRRSGLAALALGATMALAACGSSDSSTAGTSTGGSGTSDTSAAAQTFGSGCAAVPKTGAGSFQGMATAPVASAASANPVLSTLVTAVQKAGLVDTLNSQKAITVFAPTNDAFAAIPPKTLKAVLANKAELTKILTYHVVAGKIAPDQLAGTHKTLEGDKLTISGSNDDFTVGAQKASIVCGNVPTANATVYIISSVLMPKM
ncbi:MAG: fasciclin domain-containing protein [Nocardioides sp.]